MAHAEDWPMPSDGHTPDERDLMDERELLEARNEEVAAGSKLDAEEARALEVAADFQRKQEARQLCDWEEWVVQEEMHRALPSKRQRLRVALSALRGGKCQQWLCTLIPHREVRERLIENLNRVAMYGVP